MDSSKLLNTGLVPDSLIRWSIRNRLKGKLEIEKSKLEKDPTAKSFFEKLNQSCVAEKTDEANEQHYELPPAFFEQVLGSHLKYSCGLWENGAQNLDQSEKEMLGLYCKRAELQDGQKILDLGCGWGSLSLYLAEKYPNSKITAVSNSNAQRKWIEKRIQERSLKNVEILTQDANALEFSSQFDRILSVEMFEHMRNYPKLFKKIASWLTSEGRLFVHIFCHQKYAYFYECESESDWMTKYFFEGGTMPSYDLFSNFKDDLQIVNQWKVNGIHYERTCNEWLKKMDSSKETIMPMLQETYGNESRKWWIYWRVFFMACAELFGYNHGDEWFVGHYLFKKM